MTVMTMVMVRVVRGASTTGGTDRDGASGFVLEEIHCLRLGWVSCGKIAHVPRPIMRMSQNDGLIKPDQDRCGVAGGDDVRVVRMKKEEGKEVILTLDSDSRDEVD